MKKYIFFLILIILYSSKINAETINGTTETILTSKNNSETEENKNIYKIIEYYDLNVEGRKNYSIYISGWTAGFLTKDKENSDIPKNELNSAFLQYKLINYPIIFKTGRFFLNEGIAKQEQIDGIYTKLKFKNNYALSLYQGIPLELADIKKQKGNLIYGSRLVKSWDDKAEINLSYLYELESSNVFRKESSIDLYYCFNQNTYFLSKTNYNLDKAQIINQEYLMKFITSSNTTFTEEYTKNDFGNIFSSSTTNIFSNLKNDTVEKWNTSFALNSLENISLYLNHQFLNFKNKKNANYYGTELQYRLFTENSSGISFYRMDAGKELNSFNQTKEFFKIDGNKHLYALEAVQIFYEKPIYEQREAYQFTLTTGQYFNENSLLAETVEYQLNALYKYEISGSIKLRYNF